MLEGRAPRGAWRALTVVAAALVAVASTAVLANAGGGRDRDRGGRDLNLGDLGVPDIVLYDGKTGESARFSRAGTLI